MLSAGPVYSEFKQVFSPLPPFTTETKPIPGAALRNQKKVKNYLFSPSKHQFR